MKKVHKVEMCSAMWRSTQHSAQISTLLALVVCFHMFSHCGCVLASVGRIFVWIIHSVCSLRLKNGFSDYLAHYSHFHSVLSFQFYYWKSRERKILEKLQTISTYTHYIIAMVTCPTCLTNIFVENKLITEISTQACRLSACIEIVNYFTSRANTHIA